MGSRRAQKACFYDRRMPAYGEDSLDDFLEDECAKCILGVIR